MLPFGFFEIVCQNQNGSAIWAFFNIGKNRIFQGLFWANLIKFQTFHETLNFNLVISTILLKKIWLLFGLFFIFWIRPFLNCLWPNLAFFHFLDLASLLLQLNYVWLISCCLLGLIKPRLASNSDERLSNSFSMFS